jgi:hypothetical protein
MLLPQFLPWSDAIVFADTIDPESVKDKQIVFVVVHASEGVQRYLLERFPSSRVLSITEDDPDTAYDEF